MSWVITGAPGTGDNLLYSQAGTPALDLRFASTKSLTDYVSGQNRVTFTRASSGTFVGSDGVLQTAVTNAPRFDHNPATGESLGLLVEEARTNVWLYSEQFDQWFNGTTLTVTANAGTSPNGTTTANKIIPSVVSGNHYVTNFATRGSGTFTFSVYAKANGYPRLGLRVYDGTAYQIKVTFDLSAGTVVLLESGTASITPVGNGWYRCSGTGTSASGNMGAVAGWVIESLPTTTTVQQSFAGDGTSGALLWGAQTEVGAFPTSYIPTPATFTGRASTATFYDSAGIIQTAASGVARSAAFFPDENGIFRPAGLLLEAAGTNLLNHSQTFATSGGTQNDWADTSITRDGTLRTSPDGTANALRITASAANATVISSSGIGTSAARSLSVFLRRVTGSGAVEYTLDNGSTYTPQAITSSWVRYAFPATTADQQVGIRLVTSGNAIELWGAQLEAGTSATSYIPTTTTTVARSADTSTSATVTRAADIADITGANFSSWFNASSGSFISIAQTPINSNWYYLGAQLIGGFTAGGFRTNGFSTFGYYASGVLQTGVSAYLNGVSFDIMGALNIYPGEPLISPRNGFMSWSSTEGIYGINGFLSSGANSPNASLISARVNKLVIGHGDNIHAFYSPPPTVHIKRLSFYPSRLSNATLQSLTG